MAGGAFSLFAKKSSEITELLELEKPFQGKQVYQWLTRGAQSFGEMTNLPKALRQRLTEEHPSLFSSKILTSQSDPDGAAKLALELYDGDIIECVLLTDKEGELTACVSSQAGCAMGCRFCRTGTLKLKRNLEDFEIVEQFMHLQHVAPGKISHVVFMGMGEPLANLDNVVSAISFMHDPEGINLSHRRITISTVGLRRELKQLIEGCGCHIAVSLHAATPEKRRELIPAEKAYSMTEMLEVLRRYDFSHQRRLSFEYTMFDGVNDSQDDARQLIKAEKVSDSVSHLL